MECQCYCRCHSTAVTTVNNRQVCEDCAEYLTAVQESIRRLRMQKQEETETE
jgi:hypothetical protein